ncbi:MAG TPA: phage head closure protein [Devosia sp.]|nr:phage head closure protein [Devosia sp.]
MTVRAGARRHEITFEQEVTSGTDEYGAPVTSWVAEPAPVWATLAPPSVKTMRNAGEKILAGAQIGLDIVEATLHPYPGVAPITWRFRYNGRVYSIKVVRLDNIEAEMTLLALVGASDGL